MFESIAHFFYIILYQPLFNALVLLYEYIPGRDFGVAIIVLTLVIRVILYPLSLKTVRSQRSLQKLQPKIKEVQEKYKNDKEKQAKEMLALYKTEKINPFSGLLLGLVQLPILIALYQVFWSGLKPSELSVLYGFVPNPGQINALFLGVMDLSKANWFFAILAGLAQFFQTKMLMPQVKNNPNGKQSDMAQAIQKQSLYVLPVFTVIILLNLPSALGLYWVVSGVFSIIQQYFVLKHVEPGEIK